MQRPTLLALFAFAAACAAGAMGLLSHAVCLGLTVAALAAWTALWIAARNGKCGVLAASAPVFGAVAVLVLAVGTGGFFGERSLRERDRALETIRECVADAEDFAVVGRVVDMPMVTSLPHGGARLRFTVRAEGVPWGGDEIPLGGVSIRVDWYGPRSMANVRHGPFPIPREGEGWMITGTLQEIPLRNGDVPLLVLRHDGRGTPCMHIPAHDAPAWRLVLASVRRRAAAALRADTLTERWPRGAALLRAMVLGVRADIDEDTKDAFRASGTIHVFAISGLHVGLLAIFLEILLRYLHFSPRARYVPVVVMVFAYAILTGGRPSAMRAAIMTACYLTNMHLGRSHDSMTALAFAAAVIAAVDPFQTLDLGFLFSFACAFGLIACMPAAQRFARYLGEGVAEVEEEEKAKKPAETKSEKTTRKRTGEEEQWEHAVAAVAKAHQESTWRWIISDVQISAVAWLVSTPLTGAYFGRFSPIALLGNLVVVPLASLAVFFGFFAVAVSLVSPTLAAVVAIPGAGMAELMATISEACAAIPWGSFETQPWPIWTIVVWYVVLFVLHTRCMRCPVADKSPEPVLDI